MEQQLLLAGRRHASFLCSSSSLSLSKKLQKNRGGGGGKDRVLGGKKSRKMVVKNKAIADPSFITSSEENNNNNNKTEATVIPKQKQAQGVLQMRSASSGRGKKRGQKVPKSETSNLEQQLVEMNDEKANQRIRGGIQSREFATVQMIMKMEGQCRVTFQFPSDFDREVGQTFKVFGRFKVILSEKFVEEAPTEVTGNVIVHDKSPAMEQFRKLEPGDEVKISCFRTSDLMDGPECDDIYNHVLEEEEEETNEDMKGAQSLYQDDDVNDDDLLKITLGSEGKANHDEILEAHRRNLEHAALESPSAVTTGEQQQQQRSSAGSEQGYVSEQSFFGDSTIPDATPQCFVEHPGVISCSKRLVKENDDGSFELWIKTKAFQAVDSDPSIYESVSKRGLIAIGAKALEEEAKQFSDKCRNEAVDETTREASEFARERENIHAGITNILQHGDIVNCVSLAKLNSFGHPTYKLRLRCRDTGREIDCMFKPKIVGDGDGWHQVLMELVAYKLNRVLGMDYVPRRRTE
jgi:hypothetical protein